MLRHGFAAAFGASFAHGSSKICCQYSRMRNGCVNTRKYDKWQGGIVCSFSWPGDQWCLVVFVRNKLIRLHFIWVILCLFFIVFLNTHENYWQWYAFYIIIVFSIRPPSKNRSYFEESIISGKANYHFTSLFTHVCVTDRHWLLTTNQTKMDSCCLYPIP